MRILQKTHYTEKSPTTKGTFFGLHKNESIRNLEVGDFFYIFEDHEDVLIFVQQDIETIYFLNILDDVVKGEIEFDVLNDKLNIIESTEDFKKLVNIELINIKSQLQ